MGWYSGSVGAGYAISGFIAGSVGDAIGLRPAIFVLASVPLAASILLPTALSRSEGDRTFEQRVAPVRNRLASLLRGPSAVWLAFLVTLYINLVSGILFTFFPLYGLAIGLTLTQIGLLTGIHGTVAASIRFASGVVFGRVSYRRALPIMVMLSGISVVALGTTRGFFVLALAWAAIGLSRGVLRVASGALVLDAGAESDSQRGGASAIYLAGLDLGKILGPIAGGVAAEAVGLARTFVGLGIAFPCMYLAASTALSRAGARARSAAEAT
jgi:predicted MFS family arabinose efflux permease